MEETVDRSGQIHLISAALKMAIDTHLSAESGVVMANPKGALDSYIDILKAARSMLSGEQADWENTIGGELIDAVALEQFIDMEFPWLIEPLLCRGFLTQIQGAPKGGKSAFSLFLCLLASIGQWNAFPELSCQQQKPLKVVYVAWEDPKIMMAKRLSLYAVGLGHDRKFLPTGIRFLFAPTFFANRDNHIAALSEVVQEYGADIVVIDTLSYAHECEENAADQMRIPMSNLTRMADELNVAIMYVHHTAKGAKEKATWERGRGSAAIAAAWHILIDWGQREEGSNVNPVTVDSKLGVHARWNIHYNAQHDDSTNPKKITSVGWLIEPQDKTEHPKKKVEIDGRNRVLEALRALLVGSPAGVPGNDIVKALDHQGIKKSTVYNHLNDLEKGYQVVRKTTGKTTFYTTTDI